MGNEFGNRQIQVSRMKTIIFLFGKTSGIVAKWSVFSYQAMATKTNPRIVFVLPLPF